MTLIPGLQERFQQPSGWQESSFQNPETGHNIHIAMVNPPSQDPAAIVVTLGGLSEYSKKYHEFASDMLARNFTFATMDWQYQGASGRMGPDKHGRPRPHRHSDGFDQDLSDLHLYIAKHILPLTRRDGKEDLPLILVAHSMGAHLGARYMAEYPETFQAAALSAPFMGIYNLHPFEKYLIAIAGFLGSKFREILIPKKTHRLTGDEYRALVDGIILKHYPELQAGNLTVGWVVNAIQSCQTLMKPAVAAAISIPVLIAIAGKEDIVDNAAIRTFAKNLPDCTVIELKDAYHEILMETDSIRGAFLSAFDKMLEENKIVTSQTLQPA